VALKLINIDKYNDPAIAIARFKPNVYNFLILDIKMPEMNGIGLCKEIRKLDSKVKVCFLTAFDSLYGEFKQCSECFI
jgi:DNA-binding response OmpR family regulator